MFTNYSNSWYFLWFNIGGVKIIIISEKLGKIASIIQCLQDLTFPFDTSQYISVPYIPEDQVMTEDSVIHSPIPYIISCNQNAFEIIKKKHWRHLGSELMWIDTINSKVYWDRKVQYPQPHTRYFYDTINYLK